MRFVVKVGSAVVAGGGELDPGAVGRVAVELADLRRRGDQPVLVSSGAVACGFRALGLDVPPQTIVDRQAAAAVGQPRLMRAWSDAFAARGVNIAQVLLTADDLEDRTRFLNARHTIDSLLARGIVPVVNENDSVSFDEIKVGDNDRLSALVASLIDADLLVLLSTVPGVLDAEGGVVPSFVRADDAFAHVHDERTETGMGGMWTKVEAAGLAAASGIPAVIAGGTEPGVIARAVAGDGVGTRFEPAERGSALRKRWIGQAARPRGAIAIDDGAARALTQNGASLLPRGVTGIEGTFAIGDAVEIRDGAGRVVARGLASYSSSEVERIKGRRSDEIEALLGYSYADEVVHRDDLVLREGADE